MESLTRRSILVLALLLLWGGAVIGAVAAAPDLTVQTFEPPAGAVERTFSISNAVRNIGTSISGVITVGFVLSSDTTFTIKDTLIGTREVRSLNAGATSALADTTVTVPNSVPGGSYYLGMFVDTENAVAESDETNNFRSDPDTITLPSPPAPDLGARYFFVQPGGATRQFVLDAGVQNYGSAPAGPFTVGYYLSADTAITAADILLGTRGCAALDIGAEADAGDYVVVPGTVPAGTYYLGIITDTGNTVAESNEGNNADYYPDPVTISDLPDLVISTFAPPAGAVERTFEIPGAVTNYGPTPAGPFSAGFYLSTDEVITTADTLIGTRSFTALAAGASSPVENTMVTVPSTVPAGSYYLGMIVDPANAVSEAYETNNLAYVSSPVTIPPASAPDLRSWTFSPPSGPVSRTFTIYNAVKNDGTAPAGPFSVGFYLSGDPTITTSDTLIGTRSYTGLAAGAASVNENTPMAVPGSVPAGIYYVGMIMDPEGVIAEMYETNNIIRDSDPVTIPAPEAPDIGTTSFQVSGTGLFKHYDFRGEARNFGTAPTGPFSVAYYLSVDQSLTFSDTLLGVVNIPDLAQGATVDLHRFWDVPASVPAGPYYLGVILDTTNAVAESNEANNTAIDPDPVVISNLPDLALLRFGLPGGTAARTFVITSAFKNAGMTAAGPFTVDFYLSADSSITTADSLIGTRLHEGLAAMTNGLTVATTVTVPGSVPGGAYYLGLIIDPADAVHEALEGNNVLHNMDTITIPPAVVPVPPSALLPTDTNADAKYDDVNGNGRADFADVVLFFNQMSWIAANEPVPAFDYNGNGRIDFADVVWLFNHL